MICVPLRNMCLSDTEVHISGLLRDPEMLMEMSEAGVHAVPERIAGTSLILPPALTLLS